MIVVDVSTGTLDTEIAVFDVFRIVLKTSEGLSDDKRFLAEFWCVPIVWTVYDFQWLVAGTTKSVVVFDVPKGFASLVLGSALWRTV